MGRPRIKKRTKFLVTTYSSRWLNKLHPYDVNNIIIADAEKQTQLDTNNTESCLGACYRIPDIPSTQMWAVSFFFVNLVLAVAIGILFMSNSTPGMLYYTIIQGFHPLHISSARLVVAHLLVCVMRALENSSASATVFRALQHFFGSTFFPAFPFFHIFLGPVKTVILVKKKQFFCSVFPGSPFSRFFPVFRFFPIL